MGGTLYYVLGVGADASVDALRGAHRGLARQLHPDSATGDAEAMRSLNGAWAVLSDPAQRAAYDRSLGAARHGDDASPAQAPPGAAITMRLRVWPFLVLGAALLVVVTAYAGRPADIRTQEPVGQCLVEGADLDHTEPCQTGGRRIVAVGGPGVQCPGGSDVRVLRGDAGRRTACVARVAGR